MTDNNIEHGLKKTPYKNMWNKNIISIIKIKKLITYYWGLSLDFEA